MCQDKDKLAEENKQFKQALAQQGIPYMAGGPDDLFSDPSLSNVSGTSPGNSNVATSYTAFSPSTAPSVMSSGLASTIQPMTEDPMRGMALSSAGKGVDVEQAGIDFVLAYERSASSRAYPSPPPR